MRLIIREIQACCIYYTYKNLFRKILLLRPLVNKTTPLFRAVPKSPSWFILYHFMSNIKTAPLIRPLLGRPTSGLNSGILLYMLVVNNYQNCHNNCSVGKIRKQTLYNLSYCFLSGFFLVTNSLLWGISY